MVIIILMEGAMWWSGVDEIKTCLNFTHRAMYHQTRTLQRFSSGGLENRFEARSYGRSLLTVVQVSNAEMQMIKKKRH